MKWKRKTKIAWGLAKQKFMTAWTNFVSYGIAGNYLWQNTFVNKQQLYELYQGNTDIRQCVRKIAQYVGCNGIKLKDSNGDYIADEKSKITKKEIEFVLWNPTFLNTKIEFIKHSVVCGELYLLPMYNAYGEVTGIQVLDPRTLTKTIRNGMITWWIQTSNYWGIISKTYTAIPWTQTTTVPLLLYFQLEKHINNELYGMWLLEWVVRDSMSDLEASKRNYYFFKNDMTPPSIFMMDPDLSEDEQNILLDQLREQYSTPKNAHKPLMGVGVTDVKQLSITPKDMEHILQRKLTTEKVCASIGVPKNLLWYVTDVNFSNWDIMMREFLEWTIDVWDKYLEHIINIFYQTFFDWFEYVIELDWMSATDYYKETDDINKQIDWGQMTLDEAREARGRKPYGIVWFSDQPLIKKDKSLLIDVWMDLTGTWLPW